MANVSQSEPKPPARKKRAFVISPIGAKGSAVSKNANLALTYIFKKAFDVNEWDVHRADEGEQPDSIGQHVIKSIVEANLIVADLTGHNPNVFYELAIAHGYRRPVVHMITEGESIPFDINDQRTIHYNLADPASVDAAISALRVSAAAAMSNPGDLITPLSSFEMFASLRTSSGPENETGDAIADALERISYRLYRLEDRIGSSNTSDEGSVSTRRDRDSGTSRTLFRAATGATYSPTAPQSRAERYKQYADIPTEMLREIVGTNSTIVLPKGGELKTLTRNQLIDALLQVM